MSGVGTGSSLRGKAGVMGTGPAQGRAKGPAELAGYGQHLSVLPPSVGIGPSQGRWEWAVSGLPQCLPKGCCGQAS